MLTDGVTYFQKNFTTPKSIQISNCSFEEFERYAINVWSGFGGAPLNVANLKVLSCKFDDNSEVLGYNYGIQVSSSAPSTIQAMSIKNNDFYFRQKNQYPNRFNGILLTNIFGGNIENNTMVDDATQLDNATVEFFGIRAEVGGGTRYYNNSISRSATSVATSSTGVLLAAAINLISSRSFC